MTNELDPPQSTPLPADISFETVSSLFRTALERREIWPAFQPIVNISSGSLAGFEVLSRWTMPGFGDIHPALFIPLLEKHGLIDELFDFVVQRSCKAAAGWGGDFSLSFNVAPSQLLSDGLPQRIVDLVEPSGFDLSRIQLEVTESTLISDEVRVFGILKQLHALGIHFAIDDFGTGHSSLARLEEFPFQTVKIDARFINNLENISNKRRIASAVIGLGHSLGIKVVAEGVETEGVNSILKDLGCDLGQGWLYGKPNSIEQVERSNYKVDAPSEEAELLDSSPFQQVHQLTALYESSPLAVAFLDTNFRYVRTNDRFAKIHHYTSAEIMGKSIYDVLDGPTLKLAELTLNRSMLSEKPLIEHYVLDSRRYKFYSSRVMDTAQELIGFLVVAFDITDENMAEEALVENELYARNASELHLSVPWAAAADGTLIYIGPDKRDFPGDSMQLRVERWLARMHPEDRKRVDQEWADGVLLKEDFETWFRIRMSDGFYLTVCSRARPQKATDGTVIRWYGIFWEVSPDTVPYPLD